MLPRMAVVGASSRSPAITSGRPMSPAWMMWSTPAKRSQASGRRRECVSEMMPIIMADLILPRRRLLVEHGGFTCGSDYYGDELPFWRTIKSRARALADARDRSRDLEL